MTTNHAAPDLVRGADERPDIERLVKGPNAYRTISEVADDLHVPQHVLRFWETRFPEVKPLKRGGGRRYYSPEDIDTLRRITDLLYVQGYTIKGVQRVLKEHGGASGGVAGVPAPVAPHPARTEHQPDDVQSPASEASRTPLEIPAFHPAPETGDASSSNAEQGGASGHEDAVSPEGAEGASDSSFSVDPGEEASGQPIDTLCEAQDAEAATIDVSSSVTGPSSETLVEPVLVSAQQSSDAALAAFLQDELQAFRLDQARWREERRSLRLALEDVLGELDCLRDMLPRA